MIPFVDRRRHSLRRDGVQCSFAAQIREVGTRRLDDLALHVCGKPLAGLNKMDASRLIDLLKAAKSGEVDVTTLFTGETA